MTTTRNLQLAFALAGLLAVAGCGGGGGGGGGFPGGGGGTGGGGNTIPDSALQSSDAFITYLKQLVATAVDNSEPIDLGNAQAPVSDTAEAANL
ncbi:MAG: hypothetical protein WKG52_02335 [Variovorax sp.]